MKRPLYDPGCEIAVGIEKIILHLLTPAKKYNAQALGERGDTDMLERSHGIGGYWYKLVDVVADDHEPF